MRFLSKKFDMPSRKVPLLWYAKLSDDAELSHCRPVQAMA